MSLVAAQFLVNNVTGVEQFVVNLPGSYEYGPNESLHERMILEADYNRLMENKDNHIKLFRYTSHLTGYDLTMPPKGLDYKIGLNTRLHTKFNFNPNGFLEKVEYFANANYDATLGDFIYDDLILDAIFNYTIDPTTKFVVHRTKTVRWFKEDGTVHPDSKSMFKIYSPIEMDEEAMTRRKNVISLIKLEVAMFLAQIIKAQYPDPSTRPDSNDAAKALIAPLNIPIMNYINGGDATIKYLILGSNDPFLNTMMPKFNKTVKNFIADRIN